MQKIINRPEAFVDEFLEGVLAAHPDALRRAGDPRAIVRRDAPVAEKVGIATGGGSGHVPVFMGYVGPGLADGAAVGNVFASPSAVQIHEVIRAVDAGRGVLLLYGNYGGDVMNFELAAELAAADGIETATVVAADDVASAPRGKESRRRGIAGIALLYKIAGAAAAEGAALEDVTATTARAASQLRSLGVALSSCTVPAAGRPTFEISAGDMEIGMGIHGEPGVRREPLEPADRIADRIVATLLADLPLETHRIDVLVNGLGATPPEELYILYRRVAARLRDEGARVRRAWIGEYATSLEMAGASVSLLQTDDELERLLDAPASSPLLARL
jgi:dihydroxyacetone kinase